MIAQPAPRGYLPQSYYFDTGHDWGHIPGWDSMTQGTSPHIPFYAILYAVLDSNKQFTPRFLPLVYNDELQNA